MFNWIYSFFNNPSKENDREKRQKRREIENLLYSHTASRKDLLENQLHNFFYTKCRHLVCLKSMQSFFMEYYCYHHNMLQLKRTIYRDSQNIYIQFLLRELHNTFYRRCYPRNNHLELTELGNCDNGEIYYDPDDTSLIIKSFVYDIQYHQFQYHQFQNRLEDADINPNLFYKFMEFFIQDHLYQIVEREKDLSIRIPKIKDIYLSQKSLSISSSREESYQLYCQMEKVKGTYFQPYLLKHKTFIHFSDIIITIATALQRLQKKYHFIHGDLKSNNILIETPQKIAFIDFEYSYLEIDGYHLFSMYDFTLNHNYDILHPNLNPKYTLDLIQFYQSPFWRASDLLYFFLTSMNSFFYEDYMADFIERLFYIRTITYPYQKINIYSILMTHRLPFEAFVYSRDFTLLRKVCHHHRVNFDKFIERFYPENIISLLLKLTPQNHIPFSS